MKILINQVPPEGLFLEEEVSPLELDLETDLIKLGSALKVKGQVNRFTNALSVKLNLQALLQFTCARCLESFERKLNKDVQFNFSVNQGESFIDLTSDLREEVMLDYPIKPLCDLKCQGLCKECGNNLNQGGCNCGST